MNVTLSEEQATEVECAIKEQLEAIAGWLEPDSEKERAAAVLVEALASVARARTAEPAHVETCDMDEDCLAVDGACK
jgi:hypothetical protein